MSIFNRFKEIVKTIRFAASPRLYGRSSSGAGNGEEITIGSGLTLVGGVLSATGVSTVAWSSITGKPATFAPSAHIHTFADIGSGTLTGNLVVTGGGFDLSLSNLGRFQAVANEITLLSIGDTTITSFAGIEITAPGTLNMRAAGGLWLASPAVIANTAAAGQVLTLTNASTGAVEYVSSCKVMATPPNGTNETKATGTFTVVTAPSVPQTLTIDGVVLTFRDSLGAINIRDIPLGLFGTTAQAATAIANTINKNYRTLNVVAVATASVVTLYSVAQGIYGNETTISSSSAAVTASGTNLSGGSFSSTTGIAADYIGQTCLVAGHVFICTRLVPITWNRL